MFIRRRIHFVCYLVSLLILSVAASIGGAQQPPYDHPPEVEPPYYRVRYEASEKSGELAYPVAFTLWIPPKTEMLRGVVVHQHGCGEGSCRSGQTGAFDLHWQSLAAKHDCALMSPSYEQPDGADCQLWCDPRNGSSRTFIRALEELGRQSQHPELARVPWALWGHSGGGHWAGGMLMLHPQRVVAAWLRSGVPLFEPVEGRAIKPHELPDAAIAVPVMCNLGTKEGVSVTEGRFSGVWPANQKFFHHLRQRGGLVGVAIDPLTSHECGNQRYLAIPWFDACLTARLPEQAGASLKQLAEDDGWIAPLHEEVTNVVAPVASEAFTGNRSQSIWLPNASVAKAWMQYVVDTQVNDDTPPPAPYAVHLEGNVLTWEANADPESGLAKFIIEQGGEQVATLVGHGKNRFGRDLFQGLQYSDTPATPLEQMRYEIPQGEHDRGSEYHVRAVNTVGLASP